MPYLFASLKVAIAASLVGAIVGELPTGAIEGLGARMLIGQLVRAAVLIWAALFVAAILAAAADPGDRGRRSSGWRCGGWGSGAVTCALG